MKLASRLRISSFISLGVLVVMIPTLIWSFAEAGRAKTDDHLADAIQVKVFERISLRDEYFLYPEARARLQWLATTERTGQMLQRAAGRLTDRDELRVLAEMRSAFDDTVAIFGRLVRGEDTAENTAVRNFLGEEGGKRLYSQLILRASALQEATFRLQQLTEDRLELVNRRAIMLTFVFISVVIIATVLNSTFVNRLLGRRLGLVHNGARIIADGNLDHRIEMPGSDELVDLAHTINVMTGKVQDYTKRLQESHGLLDGLSRQVPGILFQARMTIDGHFTVPYSSEALYEMYELTPEDLLADTAPIIKRFHPEDWRELVASFYESARTLTTWEYECPAILPRQGLKWRYGIARPQKSPDGSILWHGFIADITERKWAEDMLAAARDELEGQVLERTASLTVANEKLRLEIEERKRSEQMLLEYQHRLEAISLELSLAEERERDRIASELHDQVGQRLILGKMKLNALASQLSSDQLESDAEQIEKLLDQSLQDIRSLTFQLRPPILASAGLEAAVQWLGEELKSDLGLQIEVVDDRQPKPLRYEVRSTIFQAVRELLLNVAKHANTKHVQVSLTKDADCLVITVVDDGSGFAGEEGKVARGKNGGFGLFNVRQRVEYLGGRFMRLKILIADDHTIVREGLRSLLEHEPDMDVVGEAGTGAAALHLARELRPDVIVMDIAMPDMNGIEATRQIVGERSDVRVLALSMESDRRFVVEVLKAGAAGYVLKDSAFSELATAIRTVAANEPYLGPRITELIIREFLQRIPENAPLSCDSLTPREREILQLITDGKNAKEIAFVFNVSLKTVENQRHSIMKKLDLYSIAELTKYAVREGLTSLK
jgi:DNA-binding NarL/FixJ family response regulator/signal transduction histidine kinase